MLKKGGRLVYSTCSFNPIEDEAVVAAALSRHIKQIELVDVSKEVSPHLKYRPGMINWKVYHKGKGKREGPIWYEKYDDVPSWRRKVVKEILTSRKIFGRISNRGTFYTELVKENQLINLAKDTVFKYESTFNPQTLKC